MKFIEIFKRPEKAESLRPFTYLTPSVGTVRKFILVMMVPQLVMLAVTKSYSSLLLVLSSVLGSMASEIVHCLYSKSKKVEYLSPVIQGMIAGLLIPSGYSVVAVFFISFMCMYLGKYAFGGFSQSWINTVALTVAVAYMLDVSSFSTIRLGPELVSSRNAALAYIEDPSFHICAADSAITSFLNRTVFGLFGIVIPDGYVSFFWDSGSLIPAFRFNFITLISSIVLMAMDIIDMVIPLIFIAVYSVLVRLVGPVFTGAPAFQGDVIFALLTSGTIFSTLFLLQWYGTVPITKSGKILYACLAGVVAFLVMGYGNSPVGYVFMILIMNLFSTLIQIFESRMARKKVQAVLSPRIQAIKEAEHV